MKNKKKKADLYMGATLAWCIGFKTKAPQKPKHKDKARKERKVS